MNAIVRIPDYMMPQDKFTIYEDENGCKFCEPPDLPISTVIKTPIYYITAHPVLSLYWNNEKEAIEAWSGLDHDRRLILWHEWERLKEGIDRWFEQTSDEDIETINRNLKDTIRKALSTPVEEQYMEFTEAKDIGFVYILGGGGYFKIGKTKSLSTRIGQISPRLPFDIELIHSIETEQYHELEKELHERFADKRANGEWFSLTQGDIDWLKTL